jgi:putative hydrolase of the HAD superfamily
VNPASNLRARTPQAVLFDALGTLVALDPPAPELRRGFAEHAGVEIAPADAERAIAAEFAYYRAHLDEGRDPDSLAGLRRRCAAVVRDALPSGVSEIKLDVVEEVLLGALRFRAFEDARPALIAARRVPARTVVVSNWDISLEDVLARLGLTPLVDGVISSARVGTRKPSPEIFEAALALTGVPPQRAVHIGDSIEEDVAGAFGAGIAPVLLRRDGQPGPPGLTTISTLAELPFELWSTRAP